MRMTLYLRVPLCGLLQSVTVGSKIGSAVAAHAVNGREEEEEEEDRETQVGGFGHGGWRHTRARTHTHAHTHTDTHTHTHTHTRQVHLYICTVCKDLVSLCA